MNTPLKTCFFIGHHDASEKILPALTAAVERHVIDFGVTDFVVGHYGGFDQMAARVVKAEKERHPLVTLTLLLPYHPADRPIPVPDGFDSTFYPPRYGDNPQETRHYPSQPLYGRAQQPLNLLCLACRQ